MPKLFRNFLLFLYLGVFSFGHLFAQSADVQFDDKMDPDSKDMDALRRWLRDKRFVSMKEIGGDLALSGEVRTEFQATNERSNGIQQRNNASFSRPKPMYAWDIEVNLMLDYRTERTWAAVKIEFDNDMGIRSGTANKIRLEKAYLGGRILPGDTIIIDAEIGRRNLFNVFDSKVQFSSLFDGALFRFNKAFDAIGDYYFNTGPFLVDDITNHYGFVGEMGALGIANTGMNLKYSLINWYRPGGENEEGNTAFETALANQRYRFLVSQLLAYYQFYPQWIGKKLIKIYTAGLMNHLALGSKIIDVHPVGQQSIAIPTEIIPTGGERANIAWYAGVSIGIVKKQGDWALDANYQWVQAQAYPDFDNLGIGRGNAASVGLYTLNADGSGAATTRTNAGGNTNFKGFELEALYAITNNLVVQQNFKYSNTLNKNIGPNEKFRQYEIEFIYAF
ncbi:MAG TPA: hypothetical protein VLE95_01730 [Chlamydiales bacterium]|nr:hypothetical protein [Chlamydiales bacterium]